MNYILVILSNIFENMHYGIGMHMTISMGRIFFLGFPTIGLFTTYSIAVAHQFGLGVGASLLCALFCVFVLAFVFSFLFARVSEDSFVVLTLLSILAGEALMSSWSSVTNGVLGISGIPRPEVLSSSFRLMAVAFCIVAFFLFLEYLWLKSPYGRALRAYREDPYALEVTGISSVRLAQRVLFMACILFGVASALAVWRLQAVSPNMAGLPVLVQLISISVLALRPQVRYVVLATLFVQLVPELLRFFDFPASVFAQVRSLIYAVLLLILLKALQNKLYIPKRSI